EERQLRFGDRLAAGDPEVVDADVGGGGAVDDADAIARVLGAADEAGDVPAHAGHRLVAVPPGADVLPGGHDRLVGDGVDPHRPRRFPHRVGDLDGLRFTALSREALVVAPPRLVEVPAGDEAGLVDG